MLCEDNTIKLPELENAVEKKIREEGAARHIEEELPQGAHRCPKCGTALLWRRAKEILKTFPLTAE